MVTLTLKPKLYPDIIYSLILVISWRTENRTEANNCRLVSGKSGVGGGRTLRTDLYTSRARNVSA